MHNNLERKTLGDSYVMAAIVFLFAGWSFFRLGVALKSYWNIKQEIKISATINTIPQNIEEQIIQALMRDFTNQAKLRGIEVDLTDVTFYFRKTLTENEDSDTRNGEIVLATCIVGQKHIRFVKHLVNMNNIADLRATVFHELGHCAFGLSHDESEQTIPVLMRANHDVDWTTELNLGNFHVWDLALDYFFTQIKKST